MQNIKYFYLLFIFLIFPPDLIYAQEPIKSASEYDYPPFSIVTEKGEADGFSVELLRASLKAAGLDVKFYVGPWAKIKQDLAEGKIQVLPLVGRTPEREKIYDFSVPYLTNYGGIFVRKDQASIKTLKDLADKEILVMKGDNAEEFLLRENVSKYIITTESFEDAFKTLSEGKHDAVVAQQIVGTQLIEKLGITNVVNISRIDKYKQDWTFAVKDGDKELLASLNDGLSKIIINGTFDRIHDKWFGGDSAGFFAGKEEDRIPLTAQEQAWLKKHPEITLGGGISFEPFIMYDNGDKVIGYDADIIKIVAERTGLKVRFVLGKWGEIQDRARKRELDGLTSAMQTKERAKIYNSSKQYLNYTSLIIVKKGNPAGIHSIEDISGKRVALQKGNASKEILLEEGKKIEFLYFDTIHELIKAIVSGKADFTILDESAFYVARQLMLESMIEAPFTVGEGHTLHFLIRKDWPELVSIINKGINSIPDETKKSIKNKWFGLSDLEIKNVGKEPFSYAKKIIKQKAEDVARQVEIYLTAYPDKTLKDLQNDPKFQKIAIQPVGKTGYTAVSDYNNLINLFHPNKDLIGREIESLSADYPVMWEIVKRAEGGNDVSGIYEFPDLDGVIKDKYLYIKIPNVKTADGVGMWVAATTYLDEYETIELQKEEKENLSIIPMVWVLGILISVILFLLILNKLNIVKFEKNAIMLLLAIALLLIIGLFIFNAYNITKNLKKSAVDNYFDTLRATASSKHVNIKQHISHIKSSFKVLSSRKSISNEYLMEIVKLGEDFSEIFMTDSNGKITHSSDISHIGISRLTDPYFKNEKEGVCIKPLYPSETIREVSFTISTPYNKGVLVARMNLNHIHEIIANKEGLGQSGESLLAYRNENGDAVFFTKRRFTAEAEARDIIPKKDVNVPITQALLRNEKEFSGYVDYRGVPVFAVTKYIDEIDAGLVVKIDQEEALRSVSGNINQIWYSTIVIILAIIIIGIIFYFLLTYSLRREVKNKTNALEKASKVLSEKIILLQNSERKFIESEEKVRNIFDNSTIVHYSHGIDQVVTYISPQIENIIGYTPEEAKVKWTDLASDHPINAIAFENTMKAIKTGERQPAYELELVHKNGKKIRVEVYEAPVVKNGETISIIGSFADITDRKQAEEKIAWFGRIFENSLNEIYLFEPDTLRFVQVNPSALHNLGYTMKELKKLTALDIKPEITAESFTKFIAPLIKGETQRVVFETVHKRKNQSLYNVEVHLQLLRHEDKALFSAIILDITDRKRAEEEKVQLEEQYRQAQKMESVGRLAGGVAHDYNNALTAIMGFTELAMMDADPAGPLHKDLNQVLMAGRRAQDITRQLLAFARKQTIAPIALNLNQTVESTIKMLRRLIGEDIDLVWLPRSGLWHVKMDPSQIDQILANLCVNARDAITGVGKITIETATNVFDSAYCADHVGFVPGEFVMMTVSDNGCGMDKEIRNQIFEPFFTTKAVDKGTGLGLSTVYGIIKQNNGFINVYSEPGKGTSIKIYIPRHEGKAVESQEKNTAVIPQGHGETILLVEDDLLILELTEKILNSLGYTVLAADTPKGAMRLAKEHTGKIYLLVTDVIMPEMNGLELSEQLQSLFPDLKCIFMSGYTANAIAHHGVLDEGVHFVQKPFSKRDLATIVRKVLDRE